MNAPFPASVTDPFVGGVTSAAVSDVPSGSRSLVRTFPLTGVSSAVVKVSLTAFGAPSAR